MIVEILIFILILYGTYNIFRKKENLPPGPIGIPFFGNIPVVNLKQAESLKRKYGKIAMTKLGAVRFLYIFDYKISKEALSRLELADRPKWSSFKLFDEEILQNKLKGIIFSNGKEWHHTRRFLLRHLRDLGMGKSRMEGVILREAESLVSSFENLAGAPTKLPFSINICVLNVIWQLVASHRYDYDDQEVENFMSAVNDLQNSSIIAAIPDFFPIFQHIIPESIMDYITDRNALRKVAESFEDIVQPFIDEHTKKLDRNDPKDIMDEYLLEMMERKSEDLSHFCKLDFLRNVFDLFVAGNDTTASLISWALLYLIKFPHIQKKVQEEIDRVVPSNILPGLEHREKLAYLDATINEVQRHCSFASFGVFRSMGRDGDINGYFIPKDTVVMAVAGLIHKDPAYWKNPDEFDPSRFIDSNGKYIPVCDGFEPFGIGKRQCLGENFARMELYLFLGALLQKFSFSCPNGAEIDIKPLEIEFFNRPNRNQLLNITVRK